LILKDRQHTPSHPAWIHANLSGLACVAVLGMAESYTSVMSIDVMASMKLSLDKMRPSDERLTSLHTRRTMFLHHKISLLCRLIKLPRDARLTWRWYIDSALSRWIAIVVERPKNRVDNMPTPIALKHQTLTGVGSQFATCWPWWKKFPSGSSGILYAQPLPGTPLSTKASRQSTLGYTHGSSLLVDRCASYELDADARHRQGFYLGSASVWA